MNDVWHRDEESAVKEGLAIGIDLGTSNSCVSVWLQDQNRAKTIKCYPADVNDPLSKKRKTMKSIVHLDKSNQIKIVGDEALKEEGDGGVLVHSTKRFIGRRLSEVSEEEVKRYPFKISESRTADEILVGCCDTNTYSSGVSTESIATAIIQKLKVIAEAHLKEQVTQAVITVPAFFNERQRAATRRAGKAAGLNVLRLLSEPMAAAMAFGLFVAGSKTIAVIDMGGGTFDVSVLRIEGGKFEALALGGDNLLGGDDVDHLLMDFVCEKTGKTPTSTRERRKLKADCEMAKIKLSTQDSVWITDELTITREEFEVLVDPIKLKVCNVIRNTINDAKLKKSDIDEVVLVGLSTLMPWFRKAVQSEFEVKELCTSVPPDRTVSQGAAIQAAVMAGVDSYTLSKVLMLDALPYSIGLETGADGKFSILLERNSRIPCSCSREFTTFKDYQRAVSLDIFEGEEEYVKDNRWVGCEDFPVANGSKLMAGEATIHVTFTVSADGCLSVNAVSSPDNTSVQQSQKDGATEETPETILIAIVVALFAMFLAAKIFFNQGVTPQ